MRYALATLSLLTATATAEAQFSDLYAQLVLVDAGRTTNDLITTEAFDVYRIDAFNPNNLPATSLELDLSGDFLGFGDTTFKAGPENPVIFGFEAPDTFFVVPDGTDPVDVLAVEVEDSSTRLAASFTVAGGAELVPGGGVPTPIVTLSVPSGTEINFRSPIGRAAIAGVFVCISCVPEPTAGVLALLTLVGSASVARGRRFDHGGKR